ncbi:MAG: dimethylsulfonioproprionate lyase family protein [Hyphomicrobiales bacterium]
MEWRESRSLVDAIVSGLEDRREEEGVSEVLARLAEQDLVSFAAARGNVLPACRHLPDALGPLALEESTLAAGIAQVWDELAWRQNANYSDRAMGQPGYMENYAYAELIGPSGAFHGDDFLLGLLVLGPGLHYPDHYHPAPELYWTLSGPSQWRTGPGEFRSREALETIWHPPLVTHATKTGSTPLLAIWAWTRDVSEPARLASG